MTRHEILYIKETITGLPRERLILENPILDEQQNKEYNNILNRRKKGEPLQYILGTWEFMGHTFKTDPRALIPRFETELLVEKALETAKNFKNPRILDICTGSGCIAISIAKAINANITATDISQDAISLAQENAELNNVNINFICTDIIDGLEDEKYDIIICNPPYIPTHELRNLMIDVKDYEPILALDGGSDGMDIYKRVLEKCKYMTDILLFEIGPIEVRELMVYYGYKTKLFYDYAELPRILWGERECLTV